MASTFSALRGEYARLLYTMTVLDKVRLPNGKTINAKATADAQAKKIIANRARYEAVSKATGVPWEVIGIIHSMECGLSFAKHLHNGDSLKARTVQVPKGRPSKGVPPFTWEESAIDALQYDGLHKVTDWSDESICFEFEGYNGWGYRKYHPETLSPYLWSFSSHYTRGKYVADGKWDPFAVSEQCGAIVLLFRIRALLAGEKPTPAPVPATAAAIAAGTAAVVAAGASLTWWDKIAAWFSALFS